MAYSGYRTIFLSRDINNYSYASSHWDTVGPLAFFHRERDELVPQESATCEEYRKKNFPEGDWAPDGEMGAAIVKMYGDLLFTAPADLLVQALTQDTDSPPVYHYIYSHQGPISLFDMFKLRPWQFGLKVLGMMVGLDLYPSTDGVCHADELFMMFKPHSLPVNCVRSQDDRRVSACLLDMWTDFATHHNPTPRDGSWTRFDPAYPQYLEIGSKSNKLDYSNDHRKRMEEWKGMWERIPTTMQHTQSRTWVEQ